MKKSKLTALVLSSALVMTSLSAMSVHATDTQQLEMTESEILSYVCTELGVTDFLALSRSAVIPPTSRIRDLSGDNQLNASDSMIILKFLNGMIDYQYNYREMDATDDYVVDQADAMAYLAYYSYHIALGSDPIPFQSGHTIGSFESKTINYVKYNAQTGAYLDDYCLSTPSPVSSAASTPWTVPSAQTLPDPPPAATDTRYLDWSEPAVVKLIAGEPNHPVGYHGTGFVVGDHVIATAAHCVKGNTLSTVKLFLTGANNYIDLTPVEVHYPALTDGLQNKMDYALVTVEQDISEYIEINFKLGVATQNVQLQNLPIKITGFPWGLGVYNTFPYPVYNSDTLHNKYTGEGVICRKKTLSPLSPLYDELINRFESVKNEHLTYWVFASEGESGSPVYYTHTYNNTNYQSVISILTYSPRFYYFPMYNVGPRITTDLLTFYYHNSNINY